METNNRLMSLMVCEKGNNYPVKLQILYVSTDAFVFVS